MRAELLESGDVTELGTVRYVVHDSDDFTTVKVYFQGSPTPFRMSTLKNVKVFS